jgi:hypothetical protein
MAGSFNNYLEVTVLDNVFGATAFTPPATLYVGISTSTIAEAGTGITEPVAMAYARIAIDNDKVTWSSATGTPTQISNAIIITYAQASGNWGIITDFFIADALTGGNILCYGSLTATKTIASGDTARFAIGDFVIRLD